MTRIPIYTIVVGVAAVALTAIALDSETAFHALRTDDRWITEPWRLITGPLIHATWGHLIRDLALIVIAGVGYEHVWGRARGRLFLIGLVVPPLGVLAGSSFDWYCGLSGLSHALLAAAIVHEAMTRRGWGRRIAVAVGVIAVVKPAYELVTGAPAFAMSLGPQVAQAVVAHVVGSVVGALAVVLHTGRDVAGHNARVIPPMSMHS